MSSTTTTNECVCIECYQTFPTPAAGVCPACSSRQIRRANPLERATEDLAERLLAATGTLYALSEYMTEAGQVNAAKLASTRADECKAALIAYRIAKAEVRS